jgi:HAE1 family hydrophobic/amphiphilic exporter-1
MTSLAFILGVLPLVIGVGPGAEMRQSLGTAVFFGMLGVTLFGLIFTPVFYVVVRAAVAKWFEKHPRKPKHPHIEHAPAGE